MTGECAKFTSEGQEFHSLGAATLNALSWNATPSTSEGSGTTKTALSADLDARKGL